MAKRKVRKGEVVLRPLFPSAAIGARYRAAIEDLVKEMCDSVEYWVRAAYRANEPHASVSMAEDALPADEMAKVVGELKTRWYKNFTKGAQRLAKHFAKKASKRVDAELRAILRDSGLSVEFEMTKLQKDIAKAVVHENVGLIKSIPEQYLKKVETVVMQSVQTGRDVGQLVDDLREQFGVTKRRASLIARDQNNKATAAFNRARQVELGVEEAVWQHSHGGKDPRPSHVKAGREGVRYKVTEGWFDPDEQKHVWPGTLINCRCTSRSVIKGFI